MAIRVQGLGSSSVVSGVQGRRLQVQGTAPSCVRRGWSTPCAEAAPARVSHGDLCSRRPDNKARPVDNTQSACTMQCQ